MYLPNYTYYDFFYLKFINQRKMFEYIFFPRNCCWSELSNFKMLCQCNVLMNILRSKYNGGHIDGINSRYPALCKKKKNCLDKKYINSKNLSILSLLNKHRTTGLIRSLSQVCGATSSTDWLLCCLFCSLYSIWNV